MAHPGGTLLEHLRRVAALLRSWGADPAVEVAGLCHANELDVVRRNPAIAAEHGAGLFRLFERARHRLSDAAWLACQDLLGNLRSPETG